VLDSPGTSLQSQRGQVSFFLNEELNLPKLSSEKNSPASDQIASSDSDGAA